MELETIRFWLFVARVISAATAGTLGLISVGLWTRNHAPKVSGWIVKNFCRLFVGVILAAIIGVSVFGCATPSKSSAGFVEETTSRVVSGLPKYDFPLVRQLGGVPEGQSISLTNDTRWKAKVFIYNSKLEEFLPGQQLVGARYFEPLYSQVPVVVIFYDEIIGANGEVSAQKCIGAAWRTFGFSAGQPYAYAWTITPGDVMGPDGRNAPWQAGAAPQPDASLAARSFKLPREAINGTAAIQLLNLTEFTMDAVVGNRVRAELPSCGFFYHAVPVLLGPGVQMSTQMRFTDRGRLVGANDFQFFAPPVGVITYQVVATPATIRK